MLENIGIFVDMLKVIFKPFGQIGFVILFSLMPLLLKASSVASYNNEKEFFSELYFLLESGSIFIYVSAFLAPYFYSFIFEFGFRTRWGVMIVFGLAIWGLLGGALLYSEYISRSWGGDKFPHYIEWSVLVPSLITWYYTLYNNVDDSGDETIQKSINTALAAAINQR
jgi:hypothetical protein